MAVCAARTHRRAGAAACPPGEEDPAALVVLLPACLLLPLLRQVPACLSLSRVRPSPARRRRARPAPQILYYDGQFDDARLCVALACSAAAAGAAVANHVEAVRLIKDSDGQVVGAQLRDKRVSERSQSVGQSASQSFHQGGGVTPARMRTPGTGAASRPRRRPLCGRARARAAHHACAQQHAHGHRPRRRRCRPRSPSHARLPVSLSPQGRGRDFDVYARVVVNAAGPFVDGVRALADPHVEGIVQPSSGTHITLPEWYGGSSVGMIIPKTKVRAGPPAAAPHLGCVAAAGRTQPRATSCPGVPAAQGRA